MGIRSVRSLPIALFAVCPSVAQSEAELRIAEVDGRAVRISYLPIETDGKPRPMAPSTILVPFKRTERLRTRDLAATRTIDLSALRVRVQPNPLRITISRRDGRTVQELTFLEDGVEFRTKAPVFGLGEGGRQFDRRGALHAMRPGWGAYERPTHGSVVPSPLALGADGWGLFVHRPEGAFDLRNRSRGRFIAPGESLDLFVIDAPRPADGIAEFYRLVGKPAMPPKWALGYMQSHRTLAGPEEVLSIGRTFREKHLPCDALIYLGTGYCPAGWNTGHGRLQFNPQTFDRPAELIRAQGDMGLKTILHVNAAPRTLHGLSVTDVPDTNTHIAAYWGRHRSVFGLGVDGWWPDDGDELPTESRIARHRAYFEGSLHERPNERPWSLHRTGYAGVARYGGWIWSGDVDSKWATLAAHVPVGLNHSVSLSPFWGTDTGGFYPSRELDGELYVRWFQFSTFCPIFRSHGRTWKLRLPWGWNTGDPGPIETEYKPDPAVLHDARVEPIARKYLELRYRLLPYNYTLAREASDTGLPLMRALWTQYPHDPVAVSLGDEYLWGRDLLVAPVVQKGAKSRRLYLPKGTWFDWWTGAKVAGGRWIERTVDLATIPLYARAGSVIPLDPVRQYTEEKVSGPTTLRVFPGADGTFRMYDDDGKSVKGGSPAWIQGRWEDLRSRLTLSGDARTAAWKGQRTFVAEIVGSKTTKPAVFRGKPTVLQ